jgi:integrase
VAAIANLVAGKVCHPGEHLFKSRKGGGPLTVPTVNNMVKAWCRAVRLKENYGSHSLRKTWGYHQRVTYKVDIPTLMVCFNHATQRQTLDYLCIQPEEIRNVFRNEL